MQDKVAIVTGAAGSLGLASVRALLAAGARVMLVDREAAALARACAELDAGSERLATYAGDVAAADTAAGYVADTLARWGRLDVMFANAGINGQIAPITEYPDAVFDQVMAVNVRGCYLACKHAMAAMSTGGSIILNASVVGVTADPGICAYATSKHAIIGLMRVAAKEGGPRGIRVNVLAPGPIANAFQADIERRLSGIVGEDATALLDSKIPPRTAWHPARGRQRRGLSGQRRQQLHHRQRASRRWRHAHLGVVNAMARTTVRNPLCRRRERLYESG
ncbi:SDR family NAD(P)-dependent oxidoreductase [Verticiella sediminum]|uniref:SDR family NAD(P)-dependent oxidoreductase n=1 Tax=Verticiella sediminum TaxID=1247510 RepID=UPI001B883AF3|nr:SDR family NAD(P)-dependent oxidoreductase [Verticiella sediminum]